MKTSLKLFSNEGFNIQGKTIKLGPYLWIFLCGWMSHVSIYPVVKSYIDEELERQKKKSEEITSMVIHDAVFLEDKLKDYLHSDFNDSSNYIINGFAIGEQDENNSPISPIYQLVAFEKGFVKIVFEYKKNKQGEICEKKYVKPCGENE